MYNDTRAALRNHGPRNLEALAIAPYRTEGKECHQPRHTSYLKSIDTLKAELGIKEITLPSGKTQYMAAYSARTYTDSSRNIVVMRGGNKFRSEQQVNEMLAQYTLYRQAMAKDNEESLIHAKTIANKYLPSKRFVQEADDKLRTIIGLKVANLAFDSAYSLAQRAGLEEFYVQRFCEITRTVRRPTAERYAQIGHEHILNRMFDASIRSIRIEDSTYALELAAKNQTLTYKHDQARAKMTKNITWLIDYGDIRMASELARRFGLVTEYSKILEHKTARLDEIVKTAQTIRDEAKITSTLDEELAQLQQALTIYKEAMIKGQNLPNDRDKVIGATLEPRQGRMSGSLATGLKHAAKYRMKPRVVLELANTYLAVLDTEKRIDLLWFDKSRQRVQEAYDAAVKNRLNPEDIEDMHDHLQKHEAFEKELRAMYAARTDFVSFTKVLDNYRNEGLQFDPNVIIKQYWQSQTKGQGLWGLLTGMFRRRPVYQPRQEPSMSIAFPGLVK